MTRIFLLVFVVFFISSGVGHFIVTKGKLSNQYFAPLGFAAYLFLLQLCYYPLLLFSLSSKWLMAVSCVVSGLLFIYSLIHIKDIVKNYLKLDTLWVIASLGLFFIIFYQCSVSLNLSDSSLYLNYIAQNIDIEHLGQFSFSNGLLYDNPDVFYLFQGYYYFASFLCWVINFPYYLFGSAGFIENMVTSVWALGLLYSLISTFFILNVVNSFKIENKFLKFFILIFACFFYNFYYWRVALAFYGNTWRTLWVGMLIFYLYQKYEKDAPLPLFPIVITIGAGLTCSSSFLFISFDIIYLLMAYFYLRKTPHAFHTLAVLASPIVLYAAAFISSASPGLAIGLSALAILYYVLDFTHRIDKILEKVDAFLSRYAKYVLLLIIPLFFVGHSIYTWITDPWYGINFMNYFEDHSGYDMFVDPFGYYANPLEKVLNLLKWTAIILFIVKGWKKRSFLSVLFFFTMVIFLNPLTITSISLLYTYNVYYRAFDILLNPFTLILFIVTLSAYCSKKWMRVVSYSLMGVSVILLHAGLFTPLNTFTSYSYYLEDGKSVDPIYKIGEEEIELIQYVKGYNVVPKDKQIAVISHVEGFKTYFPNIYQVFTRSQVFNTHNRIDDTFYDIAKRHFSWDPRPDVDYSLSCDYLRKYDVQLTIINTFESFEFDQATDACTTTIYKSDHYHVKVLNPEE